MRSINAALFNSLRARSASMVTCWTILRTDGQVFGFTSYDQELILPDTSTPASANGVSAPATTITPTSGGALLDLNLNVWTFDATVYPYKLLRNGSWAYGSVTGLQSQVDIHGVVWVQDENLVWWKDNGWTELVQQEIPPFPSMVVYYPINGIAGEATVTKNDFSANNSSAKIVFGGQIQEHDVRIGLFDFAEVRSFWVDPTNISAGTVPIQRGHIGEVTMINNEWTAELRSLLDMLQLPFGRQYNLECDARLGDSRCGVPLPPPRWAPHTTWCAAIPGDARFGGVVQPSVPNGFWYMCINGTVDKSITIDSGTSFTGLGADPFVGTGINPFNGFGPVYGYAFAAAFEGNLATSSLLNANPGNPQFVYEHVMGGATGATEPVWPTTNGATITDGQLTWEAFPANIQNGTVTGAISRTQFQDSGRTEDAGWYQYGTLQFLSGNNAGKLVEVRQQTKGDSTTPTVITLLESMPAPIHVGDTYRIMVGCSKIRTSCQTKFNNILNHRGFPDMPTEDRALTTPDFSTSQPLNFSTPSGGGGK